MTQRFVVTEKGHRFFAKPSRTDHRDYGLPFPILYGGASAARSSKIVITGSVGPTKNQKTQGSCTAHGGTSLGERLYRRWKDQSPIFSPAFQYYRERQLEGTLSDGDCGAEVVTSLIVPDPRAQGGVGFCPETLMPYNENDCNTPPSDEAISAAAQYPGGAYHNIGNVIANIKACIASDYTFVVGIAVYESFESDEVMTSGIIPFPSSSEQLLGFHEVHAGMECDDNFQCGGGCRPGAVLLQNSWGTSWGTTWQGGEERGFAWLPYDYLANPALTTDVRMGHLGKPW